MTRPTPSDAAADPAITACVRRIGAVIGIAVLLALLGTGPTAGSPAAWTLAAGTGITAAAAAPALGRVRKPHLGRGRPPHLDLVRAASTAPIERAAPTGPTAPAASTAPPERAAPAARTAPAVTP